MSVDTPLDAANHGKTWTIEMDQQLIQELKRPDATLSSVATACGRTAASILGRMQIIHDNAAAFEAMRKKIIAVL